LISSVYLISGLVKEGILWVINILFQNIGWKRNVRSWETIYSRTTPEHCKFCEQFLLSHYMEFVDRFVISSVSKIWNFTLFLI
jgi:hypothetical protein